MSRGLQDLVFAGVCARVFLSCAGPRPPALCRLRRWSSLANDDCQPSIGTVCCEELVSVAQRLRSKSPRLSILAHAMPSPANGGLVANGGPTHTTSCRRRLIRRGVGHLYIGPSHLSLAPDGSHCVGLAPIEPISLTARHISRMYTVFGVPTLAACLSPIHGVLRRGMVRRPPTCRPSRPWGPVQQKPAVSMPPCPHFLFQIPPAFCLNLANHFNSPLFVTRAHNTILTPSIPSTLLSQSTTEAVSFFEQLDNYCLSNPRKEKENRR